MKIKFIKREEKEILDFEREIDCELIVTERETHAGTPINLTRFYVMFENSVAIEGNLLVSEYGNGETIDEALQNYCREISNKVIFLDVLSEKRKQIKMPKLIHTKLLGY